MEQNGFDCSIFLWMPKSIEKCKVDDTNDDGRPLPSSTDRAII